MTLLGEPLLQRGAGESAAACVGEEGELNRLLHGAMILREQMIDKRWRGLPRGWWPRWSGSGLGRIAEANPLASTDLLWKGEIGVRGGAVEDVAGVGIGIGASGRVDWGCEQALCQGLLAFRRGEVFGAALEMFVLASGVLCSHETTILAAGTHALLSVVSQRSARVKESTDFLRRGIVPELVEQFIDI